MPNVLTALTMAQRRQPRELVHGVNALYHFLETRGWYDLAADLLTEAVAAARAEDDPRLESTDLPHG